MTPLSGLSRSISSPSGRGGDAAQEHVAAGQLGTTGKLGDGVVRLEKRRDLGEERKHARDSLTTGARDIETLAHRVSVPSLTNPSRSVLLRRRNAGNLCSHPWMLSLNRSSELYDVVQLSELQGPCA